MSGPQQVVFVASLGHSGSTLLELLLAAHPDVTGLGEVRSLLSALDTDRAGLEEAPCSCGRAVGSCSFWGPLLDDLAATTDPTQRYRLVLDAVPSAIAVDSSKNLRALDLLVATGVPVTVVHLVRDVRSWSVSYRDRSRRKGELAWRDLVDRYGARGVSRRVRRTPFATFRLWHRANLDIERHLRRAALPVVTLGYEALSFDPERALGAIARALDIEWVPGMARPDPSGSHSVLGNRMAHDPEKLRGVVYDSRWLARREWQMAAFLSPAAMRYNAETVYRRGAGGSTL